MRTSLVRPVFGALAAVVAVVAAVFAAGGARADDPETARWVEWHRHRALRLRAQGLWTEAAEEWGAIAWLTPGDPHTAIQAAIETVEAGALPPRVFQPEDPAYKRAEAFVREAMLRGGAHDGGLAYAVGRLRLAANDWPTAYTMLRLAQDHGFDRLRARYWFFLAAVNRTPGLLDEGKVDEAVRTLEDLLRELPRHPSRLALEVNLATSYRYRQEHGLAENVLRTAIALRPDAARPWDVLGQLFADQQRHEDAAGAFRRAIELAERSGDETFGGPKVLGDALIHAATIEIRRGRLDEADLLARRANDVRRDDAEVVALLSEVLRARGGPEDVAKAVVLLRRAVRLDPKNLSNLTRLVETLYAVGEDAEAEEHNGRLQALKDEEAAKQKVGTMEPPRRK